MGKLSDIMLGKSIPIKYGDPGNLILIVQINGVDIPNVLIDLGATINFITSATVITLGLRNLKPTPTVLELEDRSTIRQVGTLEDTTISVESWQYHIDLLVLHTQSPASGHPLILGRPWLTTVDDYVRCRSRNMMISNGEVTKSFILYPLAEPSSSNKQIFTLIQKSLPTKEPESEDEKIRPILTIDEALCFKDETEDNAISTFFSNPDFVSNSTCQLLEIVMSFNVQEVIEPQTEIENILEVVPHNNVPIEIEPGKTLNINPNLSHSQSE